MKAVNLIPEEAAKGARPKLAISAQGIGAYAVIAVLAMAVVLVGAWATTNKQVNDRQSELAKVERDAQVAETKVAALKPYTEFASLSKARVETVRGLVDGRFDWAHGLREVARVVPADVDLMSLVGSVSPAAQVEGATTGKLRPGLALPAFDLSGCAKSQSDVALLLARLRAIDGVERVSLASSEKSDSASQGATDCRKTIKMPQFQVTVFFKANDGLVVAAAGTPAQPASPASPATSAAPAASSTASAGGVVK